jgi:hypothetical protein
MQALHQGASNIQAECFGESSAFQIQKSASAGHSRHPSAIAPHSASPGPHRYVVNIRLGRCEIRFYANRRATDPRTTVISTRAKRGAGAACISMLCCTIDKAREIFFTTVKRQPIDSVRALLQHWAAAMKKPNPRNPSALLRQYANTHEGHRRPLMPERSANLQIS